MPKHNIDRIAAVALAAQDAFNLASEDDLPKDDDRFPALKVRVLEAIHGEPKEQAGGTPEEQRADRLFSAIVKALTVRL